MKKLSFVSLGLTFVFSRMGDSVNTFGRVPKIHLLTTLGMASILACVPVAQAQAIHSDSERSESAVSSVTDNSNPADHIVPIFPEKVIHKKLKIKRASTPPPRGTDLLYKDYPVQEFYYEGLIPTGKSLLMFSSITYADDFNREITADLVVSSSKDGTKWNKVAVAVPQSGYRYGNGPFLNGFLYDSLKKRVVLLQIKGIEQHNNSEEEEDAFSVQRQWLFSVAFGKGGKFTKPKDFPQQFENNEIIQQLDPNPNKLIRGICLTKGKYKGRLLFIVVDESAPLCSIFSDDHGRTWKVGSPFHFKHHQNVEPLFCEAKDGTIVSYLGRETWDSDELCFYSKDGGETWATTSRPPRQMIHPNPEGFLHLCIREYLILNTDDEQGTNSRILAISETADNAQVHVAISYDWGLTWSKGKFINTHLAKFNRTPFFLISPGTIGLMTSERSEHVNLPPTELFDIGFTSFTISWLTDGKDDGIGEVKPSSKTGETPSEAPGE